MKKAIKEAWLSALRSGEYKQCQNHLSKPTDTQLENGKSFCCIGVLGVLDGAKGYLDTHDVVVRCNLHEYKDQLIKMNDDEDKDFVEIADWIEQNVKTED